MKIKLLSFKKISILTVAFMLLNTMASATSYTAISSGNWSSSSTWGGTIPPLTITMDQVIIPTGINVEMDNDVTLNGASTQITVNGTLVSAANNNLTLSYGTIGGSGVITIGSVTLGSGAAMAFTGNFTMRSLTNSALNLAITGSFTIKESLTLTSGVVTIQAGGNLTMSTNSTILIGDGKLITNGGTLGLSSVYNVTYTSSTLVSGLELTGTGLNNLTIEVGAANTITLAGNLRVNGVLTLSSGTLDLSSFGLTLNGDISAMGSGKIKTANSNLTFNSTSGFTGVLSFSGSTNELNNLTVNVGSLNKVQLNGDLVVNGTLELTSGTLQLSTSNFILKGGLSASGSGNISTNATSNFSFNTAVSPLGILTFASGGNTVSNFTVNIADNGKLILGSDLIITGTLNLNEGFLDVDDNKITVTNGTSIVGASRSSYIMTSGSGALSISVSPLDLNGVVYPIGTALGYFPANVSLNVGSTGGKVDLNVSDNVYAQGTSGIDISANRHVVDATWMVTSNFVSNMNMKLKVMWASAAEVNGFTRSSAYISHYTNNKWDASASANATAETDGMFSITRTGITSLSPFAVFDPTTSAVTALIEDASFTIYPNPAVEFLSVTTKTGITEPLTLSIMNISGQVVFSSILDHETCNISVMDLKPGYYIIKLKNSTLNLSERFIKN